MSQINIAQSDQERERAIDTYIQALDCGDLEAVAVILDQAASDPILNRLIHEVNTAFYAEEGLDTFAIDAEQVRALVRQYMHSAFIDEAAQEAEFERPLTVGEVIARLESERQVPKPDRDVSRKLRESRTELPDELTTHTISDLALSLGIAASDRFWRVFRETAIMLGLGNSQAQARLAAAREQRTRHGSGQVREADNEREEDHSEHSPH